MPRVIDLTCTVLTQPAQNDSPGGFEPRSRRARPLVRRPPRAGRGGVEKLGIGGDASELAWSLLRGAPMARVIVAEDDSEMRRLVVEALQKDGHDVTEATDGGGLLLALAEASRINPPFSGVDCIVSDVRMPRCGGLDLLERLVEVCALVPIILMTAFGDDDVRARAEKLGAIWIEKPLSLDALRSAVGRVAR